jgi:hypothetical protein
MRDKPFTHFLFLITTMCITQSSFALEYLHEQRNIPYTRLSYEASKLLLTLGTEVTLSKNSVEETSGDLVTPKKGDVITPQSGSVYIVTTDSSFFGKHTTYTMWFDDNAAVLQRLKELRRGSKSNAKLYRFAENGKYDFRYDFNDEDFKINLVEVKNWGNSFKAYPAEVKDGQVVSESSALLYLVSQLKLQNPGDEANLVLYSDDQLINTTLFVEGMEKLKTDFTISSGGDSQRIKEKERSVIKVVVKPVDSQGNPVRDLEVMGLKGNISMYIDEATRLLLQISGDIDIAGEVDIKLKSAVKAP